MKKKFKLFATIGSLALAICMMTIGVLAAATVSLNVTSTVTFDATATSLYVSYTAKVERASSADFTSPETLGTEKTANNGSESSGNASSGTLEAWEPTGVAFEEGKQFIRYTIVFTNNTSDRNIKVEVADAPSDLVGQITVTDNSADLESIAPAGTGTWSITLELINVQKSVSGYAVSPNFTISFVA